MSTYVDAGDVDLDKEVVRREDGSRITEAEGAAQGERIARRGWRRGHKLHDVISRTPVGRDVQAGGGNRRAGRGHP